MRFMLDVLGIVEVPKVIYRILMRDIGVCSALFRINGEDCISIWELPIRISNIACLKIINDIAIKLLVADEGGEIACDCSQIRAAILFDLDALERVAKQHT